jgi:hypothetical protein
MYVFRTQCEPYSDDGITEIENLLTLHLCCVTAKDLRHSLILHVQQKVTSFTTIAIPKGTTLEVS